MHPRPPAGGGKLKELTALANRVHACRQAGIDAMKWDVQVSDTTGDDNNTCDGKITFN